MISKNSNPHFYPEITNKVNLIKFQTTVINFTINMYGLID